VIQLNPWETTYFEQGNLPETGFTAAVALGLAYTQEYGSPLRPELNEAVALYRELQAGGLTQAQAMAAQAEMASYSGFSVHEAYQYVPPTPTPGPSPSPVGDSEWGGILLLALGALMMRRR